MESLSEETHSNQQEKSDTNVAEPIRLQFKEPTSPRKRLFKVHDNWFDEAQLIDLLEPKVEDFENQVFPLFHEAGNTNKVTVYVLNDPDLIGEADSEPPPPSPSDLDLNSWQVASSDPANP